MSREQPDGSLSAVDFDPFAAPELTSAVPSTEPQREIWTASHIGPEASLAFNESVSLHMRGSLDLEALEGSLTEVARRHESLRATFSSDGLSFLVAADADLKVRLVDLSSLPARRQEEERGRVLAEEVETPFDLEHGPLFRALILKLGSEEHLAVLTGHHIIVDGWSWAVLVQDWAKLYSSRRRGEAVALGDPDRFSEYARRETERLAQGELSEAEAYWVRQFPDEVPVLDLPSDRPRPALKTFAARREDVGIDADLVQRLKKVGAREGASFFTTLLAGFKVLLQRIAGADDLVVGIPAAGQAASGLEGLVGHCVSTLPLRSRLRSDEPFRDFLKQVRGTMLDAYDHQQITLGSLLRKLSLPRDPSRQPLVAAVFNIDQELSADALAFDGLEVRLFANPRHFETFDLFVNAVESKDGLVFECQYNSDLFDRDTVRRWMSAYEILLRAVVDDVGQAVGSLPLLTESERERILVDWNRTQVDHRPEATIHQLFVEQAAARPDAVALLHGDDAMTYGDLDRRSSQLANRLRRLGVDTDTPVALLLERSFDMAVALLGVLKAGGAYMPLEHNYPAARLAFMLDDAGVKLLLTQSSLVESLPEFDGDRVLLDQEREGLAEESTESPETGTGPSSLAYIMYTSGSTGRPKGVEIVHRAVNRLVLAVDYVDLGPEATLLHCANLAFDASTFEIWGALLTGGRCALYSETVPTAAGLGAAVEKHEVTTLFLTTALFNAVVDEDPMLLGGLRQLYVGGEAASLPHTRRFLETARNVGFHNVYGPTEATTFATCWPIPRPLPSDGGALPIGRPIRSTRLYVLDPRRQPVPVGITGELYIGGDGLARGYLGRPELTDERFVPDPFVPGARIYKTGDLVRYLADGAVDFVGRVDNQVKIRGFRIELGEIEAALATHPEVAQTAVVVRDDAHRGKTLVAYVVPAPGTEGDEGSILDHLRRTLPKFMIPQHVMMMETLPLNASGKVDRRALPEPTRSAGTEEYLPPGTPTETLLASLFGEALGLPRIGIHDDFFRLGGHSLLAAQVLSRLDREHQVVLPFRTIFEAPTIAQLAAAIDSRETEAVAPEARRIPRRQSDEPAPASLMQERLLLLEELDPDRRRLHNVPSGFRLEGPLDAVALEQALGDVVQRQASLRTTFARQEGVYRQIVAPSLDLRLDTRDLRGQASAEREKAVRTFLEEETARPFDLESGPLFRACLLQLSDDEHILFTLRHNAIWDGWSFDIFRHELASFYEARTGGAEASLPELPVSYGDFAAWHRDWLEGPEIQGQVEFWRRTLAGNPMPVELPVDRPRPAARSYGGANEWIQIPRADADALAEVAGELGATTFMVLLAAYSVLLHRYSGQTDLLVASPVRNRPRPEIENVVGLFTNTLMLRNRLDPTESFSDLVRRVRETTLDAFSHQELPFDYLAQEAPPMRVLFSMQEARHRETSLGPVRLSLPHILPPVAAIDINFWLVETKDGLTGAFNYNTDIFDGATMRGFLAHYQELLRSIRREPSTPVGSLALIPSEEKQRLVAAGAPPPSELDQAEGGLLARLAGHAKQRPSALALQAGAGARAVTWSALLARVRRLDTWLRSRGVVSGDRVGLALEGEGDRLTALLALQARGAVPVPLDVDEPAARHQARLTASSTGWLWADPDLADELAFDESRVLSPIDETDLPEASDEAIPEDRSCPAWIATVTGPDGSCTASEVSSPALLARLDASARHLGLGSESVVLVAGETSPFAALLPLAVGARVILADPEDAQDGESLRSLLERQEADVLIGPLGVWRRLVGAQWAGGPGFVGVSTEPLPESTAASLLDQQTTLFTAWGFEELGGWCGLKRLEEAGAGPVLGAALPGVSVRVVERSLEPSALGVPGELRVGVEGCGPLDPAVPDPFVADPWSPETWLLATGERVRPRPDGRIETLDRTDGRVRVRGARVELPEVEARLLEHPAVAAAAIVLRVDAPGEPRLVAYYVPSPGAASTDTELRRHLRRALTPQGVPQHLVSVDKLPARVNGSIDLRGLPTPFATGRKTVRPPASDEERLLVELWQEALGISHVGVEDNFFDLGGHSLLSIEVIARVGQRTGRSLKPRILLLSTLEQVAAELARAQPKGS